ncbi:MAG: bifunctional diaminohydroxyphosphoribosylaminopyrimidine deaminase/5-amino-6-(5-phosphoribosylamino)uracil reductase RibD, partial [Chloroflexota bacterium]|nr:bifunctional diaminohydroxyphosphoribosylaminopyrimidine deaminase/5-amino-6-(5-phosphoribosylamino)uracil reductase RibD [Chloroflexota bacterium]
AARSAGTDVRGATMYVTLEPCCHHGKTPPCTDAIIDAGIGRVVVAMTDPDEQVAGGGIEKLRAAGIDVTVGVRRAEASDLLAAYIKLRTQHRPWVICKWAQTADGFLALPAGSGRWISGEESRSYTHKLRGLCDGICVGIGTVLADDPLLTNRSGGRQPARVVLDAAMRIPAGCQLIRTANTSPVIIATTAKSQADRTTPAADLRAAGAEILELPAAPNGVDLAALLDELGGRRWTHLLVEGGAKLLESFLQAHLVDELLVFISPQSVGKSASPLPRFDIADARKKLPLKQMEHRRFGDDAMFRYVLREPG